MTAPSAINYRIRRANPQIDEILTLSKDKVLKSEADYERLAELQANSDLLSNFARSLAEAPNNRRLYRDDLALRRHRLEFLSVSLAQSSSVRKSDIIANLKGAFLAKTIDADLPLHQKKSLAHEKIMILKLIHRHDPNYAESVQQNLTESHNPKLYRYIVSKL